MKLALAYLIVAAMFVLFNSATAAPITGKQDTLVIEVVTDDRKPVSGVKVEVLGWVEHFWSMRTRDKLAEGVSDDRGRLTVTVRTHIGYILQVGDLFPKKGEWSGREDIERKDLPRSASIRILVRQGGHPLSAKEPNKSLQPMTPAGATPAPAGGVTAGVVADL